MFEQHNKLTKATFWLLAISSLIGFICIAMLILPGAVRAQTWFVYLFSAVAGLMLLLNTWIAYRVYMRSIKALQWSVWLYALQIPGFEAGNWAVSLNYGAAVTIRMVFGSTSITINLVAIAILIVAYRAYRSVSSTNSSVEGQGAVQRPLP